MSTPTTGGVRASSSASASKTATPDAPSLAPGTGVPLSSGSSDLSATGRESQCAVRRIREPAWGAKLAHTFVSDSVSPDCVTCVNGIWATESARPSSHSVIQPSAATCASVPGTRGPNATCRFTRLSASAASNAPLPGAGSPPHPTATARARARATSGTRIKCSE